VGKKAVATLERRAGRRKIGGEVSIKFERMSRFVNERKRKRTSVYTCGEKRKISRTYGTKKKLHVGDVEAK